MGTSLNDKTKAPSGRVELGVSALLPVPELLALLMSVELPFVFVVFRLANLSGVKYEYWMDTVIFLVDL